MHILLLPDATYLQPSSLLTWALKFLEVLFYIISVPSR